MLGWKRCDNQGLLLLMKFKIFDNDDKATKHSERKECFVALLSLSKILTSSTAGGPDHPIWFHIFFIQAILVLGHYFFYTRGILVEISLLFLENCTSYKYIKTKCSQLDRILLIVATCCAVQRKTDANYSYSMIAHHSISFALIWILSGKIFTVTDLVV